MSVHLFSSSEAWQFPKPPQDNEGTLAQNRTSSYLIRLSPDSTLSSEYATAPENPFADAASAENYDMPTASDPFADAEIDVDAQTAESLQSVDTETASHFARIETIRRPFAPGLRDEMAATPGEQVRMLRRFDDGWAYAEKLATGARGLIPIDCLRMAEEDLPAFLASKRLSSYRGARSPSPILRDRPRSAETVVGQVL
ncbi:uncharacterized protein FIBRA_05819 [Fibroporia radiculosa]|uniref:SH3 domain-containing protein n=1 Tax=Fibroporia radiculosa TaxID=599839 RepID=J4GRN9_9APHY|nr:uncharacterized protein FIBRA_05819 [Fibroporia radiculosa]CCM03675.1 predicted protein [Fibroporia radiculosa]